MFKELPDVLTVQEVADLLRVDQGTIRRYIRAGKLPAHKVSERIIRILKRDILFLLKEEQ